MLELNIFFMERKFCLFLCLLFLSFNLYAQEFMKSFKQEFLAKIEAECPDSLREGIFSIEPPLAFKQFNSIKNLDLLEQYLEPMQQDDGFVLRYKTDDFCARIRCDVQDFCFDFFYIDEAGVAQGLFVLENNGVYSKTLVTQSGKRYYLDYIWGFLELKENNIPLLNCYCNAEQIDTGELEITFIPFEGTNPFVWEKPVDGIWVSAF